MKIHFFRPSPWLPEPKTMEKNDVWVPKIHMSCRELSTSPSDGNRGPPLPPRYVDNVVQVPVEKQVHVPMIQKAQRRAQRAELNSALVIYSPVILNIAMV